ncbi:hypothetical protein ABPG75_012005 [Micractinium tetrahymenae]
MHRLQKWHQPFAQLLPAGCEAMLRCIAQLEPWLPASEAAHLAASAALSCSAGLAYCRQWMAEAKPQLAAEEADRWLATLLSLASTACKLAVLRVAAAVTQPSPASTAALQPAAAGPQRAAGAGPQPTAAAQVARGVAGGGDSPPGAAARAA